MKWCTAQDSGEELEGDRHSCMARMSFMDKTVPAIIRAAVADVLASSSPETVKDVSMLIPNPLAHVPLPSQHTLLSDL